MTNHLSQKVRSDKYNSYERDKYLFKQKKITQALFSVLYGSVSQNQASPRNCTHPNAHRAT